MEILGGLGISNITKKSQNEFFDLGNWNTVNQFEKRSAHFSPGLYAGVEMRILATPKRFYFGPYISYSQYSSVFKYTVEREESLGWVYQNNTITNREYRIGMGGMIQYLALHKNNHRVQPYFSIGTEYRHAYKSIHDQEFRFQLREDPSFYSYTEASEYDFIDLSEHFLWKAGLGVAYSYKAGNKVPFAEMGFRYVLEINNNDFPKERWQLFYLNLGLRLSL